MDQELAELIARRSEQEQMLGKQDMQIAVLHWANEHKEQLHSLGLTASLLAAMTAARK